MLRDAGNSLSRFYINSFLDTKRQAAYDLLTQSSPVDQILDSYRRSESVRAPLRLVDFSTPDGTLLVGLHALYLPTAIHAHISLPP